MTRQSASHNPRSSVLQLALWLGLATALLELAVVALRTFVQHTEMWISAQAVWMAPLAYAALFAGFGGTVLVLRRTPLRDRLPELVVGTLSFVGAASILLVLPLHRLAVLVLAAGVAAQMIYVTRHGREQLLRLVQGTLVWMIAAIAAVGIAMNAWWWIGERRALAALPDAGQRAPNVLLLILDTVRAKSLGLHGAERPTTPNLERFAQHGVVFDYAIAPSPWTLPTHASIFTGRWPHELSADWEMPLDDTFPTLAEELAKHGYATAGFVANLPYAGRNQGLARGFVRYEDYPVSIAQVILSTSLGRSVTNNGRFRALIGYQDILNRKRGRHMNRDLLRWVDRLRARPFFAFVNYYDAHEPYLPKRPWAETFGPTLDLRYAHFTVDAWLPERAELTPDQVSLERNAYDASIAELDASLGQLFADLERRGLLDNTLVIVTSDHGEQFGEHGLVDHGNSLYMPLVHVPLVLVYRARLPEGARMLRPVSLRDLAATILDILGHEHTLAGRSFAASWDAHAGGELAEGDVILSELTPFRDPPTNVPVHRGPMAAVVTGRYRLIRNGDGRLELYDYVADPAETVDLAGAPEHEDVVRTLAEALARARDPRP